jgi:hypothetical protein
MEYSPKSGCKCKGDFFTSGDYCYSTSADSYQALSDEVPSIKEAKQITYRDIINFQTGKKF